MLIKFDAKILFFGLFILAYGTNACSHSSTKGVKAHIDSTALADAIEKFKEDKGRYPTQEEGLESLLPVGSEDGGKSGYIVWLPQDPWGNEYQYKIPGIHNPQSFDVWSNGADGKPGGEDYAMDCGNWKNAECTLENHYYSNDLFLILWVIPLTPLFWLPIYIIYTIGLCMSGKPFKKSLTGWHLQAVKWSFFLTLAIIVVSLFVPRVIA